VGPDHFAASGQDVALELFQIGVDVVEGVTLDFVCAVAQVLKFGHLGDADFSAVGEAGGCRIDRLLKPRIGERRLNLRELHRDARTSARCIVWIFDPARLSAPWSCMRQLESIETTVSAPVRRIESILVRAIAPETSGNLTENVPPN